MVTGARFEPMTSSLSGIAPFNPYLLYDERTYQESNTLKEENSTIRGKRKINKMIMLESLPNGISGEIHRNTHTWEKVYIYFN
jgi:hypothetical protein